LEAGPQSHSGASCAGAVSSRALRSFAGDNWAAGPGAVQHPAEARLPQQLNLRGSGWVATTRARYHRVVGPNFKFRPAFTTSTSVLILIGNAATVLIGQSAPQPKLTPLSSRKP